MSNPIPPLSAWGRSIARRASSLSARWLPASEKAPSAVPAGLTALSVPLEGTNGEKPCASQPVAYPSVDPGFPAKSVEAILEANADLLARIKLCYGADKMAFDREVLPLIRNYAQYVHLLPATPDNYFAEAGGLLRLGLEVGFFALQGTDGHIFSGRATITARKHLEPRWRQATFIAGLCGEVHLAIGRLLVTDSGGVQWTPYLTDLSHWLAEQRADRYFLKWLPPEGGARALGLFALRHVIPPQTLQYLASNNAVIVPHMLASVAGMPMCPAQGIEHNVLDDLVKRAFALVVDRNLRTSADRMGRAQLGAHVERYLLDAMRRLVSGTPAWTPNAERSRLWFGSDGLYMIWPQAASDIRKLLEADQIPGIPKAAETLAELLAQAGIVTPRTPQDIVWQIVAPPGKAIMEALRLSTPALLLAGLPREPVALPQRLEAVASDAPTAPAGKAETNPASGGVHLPERRACAGVADSDAVGNENDQGTNLRTPVQTPDGVSGDKLGQQLSLLDEVADPEVVATGGAAAVTETKAVASPMFELDAPLRLEPNVRAALSAAILLLNERLHASANEVGVRIVPTGVFVPLREFECRGVEPPTAVRVLAELSMLAGTALQDGSVDVTRRSGSSTRRGKTVVHDFGGTEVIGVVVLPRFVLGFDSAHVAVDKPC